MNPQTLTFPNQVVQDFSLAATSVTVLTFSDSVDSAGSYAYGICGVKTITLNAGTPTFLSVTAGADPINDDSTILLDSSSVTIAHAQVYTISYTVTFADYAGLSTLSGSFIFEIIDACAGATVNP